jgi:acyl-CoA synthetase (AMP-forming)/AMP-acid ligase II
MLRERADARPEAEGFIWIADGEGRERALSYASLDLRARAVAAWLQGNVRRGDRVALMFDPGIEFLAGFFGCLYAGAIAVPAYGSRGRRDRNRIEAIIRDSRPAAALTGGARAAQVVEFAASHGVRAVSTETIPDETADAWSDPAARADELAYLQYTSGSTTTPRGVMITHGNVVSNLAYIAAAGDLSAEAFTVSWLPHFHDMGRSTACCCRSTSGARRRCSPMRRSSRDRRAGSKRLRVIAPRTAAARTPPTNCARTASRLRIARA